MRFSLTISLLVSLHLARSEDHHKRAPSGFTGVRGKKSIASSTFFDDDSDENRINSRLFPVQLLDKRAPSMGFVGMRGKKPWSMMDDLDKRAPSGFFGMRGKKDDDLDFPEKRMNSGFFGMRGKKEGLLGEKRAPSMGFVGMRGRKNYDDFDELEKRAPSGFFGMRGKKIPYQFRSKFVGVRGKKNDGNFETESNYDFDIDELMNKLIEDENNGQL